MGISNLFRNGLRLGVKKTVGKITQPINSYSRFPEYALMEQAIVDFSNQSGKPLNILDVGSPKCFGLHLASTIPAQLELTDLSLLNVDEYKLMWDTIRQGAKGTAHFGIQDARSLQYCANEFDVVYSMSVVEHLEGSSGDVDGVKEMMRVLKPGGLLLLSVPYGNTYVEQSRRGFAHAAEKTSDESLYFFQRIYDRSAIQNRILNTLKAFKIREKWTVWRNGKIGLRLFRSLGENLQGMLGFLNPLISRSVNHCSYGIVNDIPSRYGELHSIRDLYGDAVIVAEKPRGLM